MDNKVSVDDLSVNRVRKCQSIPMKRLIMLTSAWLGLAAVGLPQASAPGVSGPDTIAARQASLDMSSITFRSMGDAMKAGREAKTQSYPAASLAKWAAILPRMFPPGTGKDETSAATQARLTIWQDRAGFDRVAANYAAATAKLATFAAANDTAGFTKQLEEVNQACSLCHSRYKEGDMGAPRK
jgi:cytochrome c556